MNSPRFALFAFAAFTAFGALIGSVQPSDAGQFDWLNKMNPEYKRCVAKGRAGVGSDLSRPGMHDAIIRYCERLYPPFPR